MMPPVKRVKKMGHLAAVCHIASATTAVPGIAARIKEAPAPVPTKRNSGSVFTDSAGGRRADAVTNKLQHGMGCVHGSWTRLRQICVPAAQLQSDREGGKLELPLLNLSSGSERRVCARGPAQYAWNSEAGGRCKGKSERAARVAEHSPRRQSGLR